MEVQDGEPSMKHGKPCEPCPVGRKEMQRLLDELDRQIEMEMAVYSEMEYIAGKTEKD